MPEWTLALREPDSLREFLLMELHMDNEGNFFKNEWSAFDDIRENKLHYLLNLAQLNGYLFSPILKEFARFGALCHDFALQLRLKLGFNNYSRNEYIWRKELQKAFKAVAQVKFGKENFP